MLTVPAIWDEVAKKFMRKSAEEVNKMFIVLKHMVPDFESNNMVSGVGLYSV